jgi:hypothetical protein
LDAITIDSTAMAFPIARSELPLAGNNQLRDGASTRESVDVRWNGMFGRSPPDPSFAEKLWHQSFRAAYSAQVCRGGNGGFQMNAALVGDGLADGIINVRASQRHPMR